MSKKCWKCKIDMEERNAETPDGIGYRYFKCKKCGEEFLTMNQLHEVADKYKQIRGAIKVTISKWGSNLAMRIPKEVVRQQKIKEGEMALIFPEKKGFKVVPE